MSRLTKLRKRLAARKKKLATLETRIKVTRGEVQHTRQTLHKARANLVPPLRERAAREAEAALARHVFESGGNNRGKAVEEIITYAGGQVGEPWCVDFVIWCYGHAGSTVVKRGFTRAVAYMKQLGVVGAPTPLRGNIVRYTFDHTGIFLGWCDSSGRIVPQSQAGYILTIEGNTGTTGAVSDGNGSDGVYKKVRSRALVRDFLHVTR